MAVTRLSHVEHGYHVAYDGAEVKRLEESGWKKVTEAEFKAIVAAKSAKVEVEEEEVVEAPKKKKAKA